MPSFSVEWLALREPADAAARSVTLADAFATRARRIVDLACGTGSNIRFLAPRLLRTSDWLAVDQDARLLDALAPPAGARVSTLQLDLAHALDEVPLAGRHLVTASALLDLVSAPWLARLAARCAESGADVLFALTYDGRIGWSPAEEGDERVRELINRHQLGDKGFGAALGPGAAAAAVSTLSALGYEIRTAPSDWSLGPESPALQTALIDGWALAAAEVAPADGDALRDWAKRRRAHVAAGRSRLRVGHLDVAGQLCHHARADREDRRLQEHRGPDRLRAVQDGEGGVGARQQGGLRQEHRLRPAEGAAVVGLGRQGREGRPRGVDLYPGFATAAAALNAARPTSGSSCRPT